MSQETLAQLRAGQLKLKGTTRLNLSCGLTEVPPEIFDLADALEVLDLSNNQLSSLPPEMARLSKLRVLFCSDNLFTELPAVLGQCASLEMIGFRANQIHTVDGAALPAVLRWFILTDNHISEMPSALGRCHRLQKLMLSGNRLSTLPEEMVACENLEMIRIASNQFKKLPDWFFKLPRLTWLALAGNPCATGAEQDSTSSASANDVDDIHWSTLTLDTKLGEGASGIIHKATWQPSSGEPPRSVAVKLFKAAMTSDGLPSSEMAASLAVGAHPNLIEILGRVTGHPAGTPGLVMSLVDPSFINLAGPPSFASCTRDVYAEGTHFSLPVVLRMATGMASAAQQLHARGIMHGDLYAHNVLWNEAGHCLLGDFGAASFYDRAGEGEGTNAHRMEQLEVRAFACFLEELLTHGEAEQDEQPVIEALWALHAKCDAKVLTDRPSFAEIGDRLREFASN